MDKKRYLEDKRRYLVDRFQKYHCKVFLTVVGRIEGSMSQQKADNLVHSVDKSSLGSVEVDKNLAVVDNPPVEVDKNLGSKVVDILLAEVDKNPDSSVGKEILESKANWVDMCPVVVDILVQRKMVVDNLPAEDFLAVDKEELDNRDRKSVV